MRVLVQLSCYTLVACLGCGSTSSEVRAARSATYVATRQQVLDLAIEIAKAKRYDVEVDQQHLLFAAHPNHDLYSRTDRSSTAGGYPHWALEVAIIGEDKAVSVRVTPKVWVERLYAAPMYLSPDDPNVPGVVTERAEALAMAIYERAKPWVTSPSVQ
jgi:hypothetical protein